MTHSEAVFFAGRLYGTMHVSDWGVVFQPIDNRADFAELRLQTWETVEAAQLAISSKLRQVRRHG
jgi:hypothetical protein